MRTAAIIAASLISAATLVTGASAASSQDKQVRWQHEQQARHAHNERMSARPMATSRATYGAPARRTVQTRADPENATPEAAPSGSLSVPGSGAAIYSYDTANKNRFYGY